MLTKLANDVALDCGKQAVAVVRMSSVLDLPADKINQVRKIAVQLVRNAVAHGVEDPATRLAAGKSAQGQLNVNLTRDEAGEWQLSMRDDGGKLNAARTRQKLIDLSWYTPSQLESFSDKQIVSHIFKPGFSTADSAGKHAGRGVGLDVVQSHVQNMGARLLLPVVPNQYTEFKVRFSP